MAALRHERERTSTLLKVGAAGPLLIAAWVIGGSILLSSVIVAVVAFALVVAYGAAVTVIVGGIARHDDSYQVASRRLEPSAKRYAGRDDLEIPLAEDEAEAPEPRPSRRMVEESNTFHVTYFMNRLTDEVRSARRHGHQMSVVVLDVMVPGSEVAAEQAETVSQEVARIAALHPQTITQLLAIGPTEFIFSMARSDARTTKEFVSQVVGALGDYWCHFGTASFPREATSAEALIDAARDACETSRRGGTRGKRRPSLSA